MTHPEVRTDILRDPAAGFDILRADYIHYRKRCLNAVFDAIPGKIEHITKSVLPVAAVHHALIFLRIRLIKADGNFVNQPYKLLCNIAAVIDARMSVGVAYGRRNFSHKRQFPLIRQF